jgi:hypothetical protein
MSDAGDNATLRPIAVVRDYDGMRASITNWCAQQGITRAELDARAGLTDGHSGKLLSARRIRKFTNATLGPVLAATGLVLIVAQDPESDLRDCRQPNASDNASATPRRHWRTHKGTAWARRMNGRRTLKLTADRRREIARRAAQARWQRR